MEIMTLEVPVSSDLFLALGSSRARAVEQVKEFSVLGLYQEGRISAGKAAELLGLTKAEFVRLLAHKGHPYLDFTADELIGEFEAVEAWEHKRLKPALDDLRKTDFRDSQRVLDEAVARAGERYLASYPY